MAGCLSATSAGACGPNYPFSVENTGRIFSSSLRSLAPRVPRVRILCVRRALLLAHGRASPPIRCGAAATTSKGLADRGIAGREVAPTRPSRRCEAAQVPASEAPHRPAHRPRAPTNSSTQIRIAQGCGQGVERGAAFMRKPTLARCHTPRGGGEGGGARQRSTSQSHAQHGRLSGRRL